MITAYDERQWVPWWANAYLLASVLFLGVVFGLLLGWVIGVVAGLALLVGIGLLVRSSGRTHVQIDEEFLHAGRIDVPLVEIVKFTVLSKRDTSAYKPPYSRRIVMPACPFWMPRAVLVEMARPLNRWNPIPQVLVGSRHPDELAKALEQAITNARRRS